ncbi:hypothetical protein [Streptomyces sp. NPDC046821]|uniref:hypothetical protein n=1 Tax=Streptomyces sp. NPDC046821 TaxID=3154702 RepID=UPI0033E17978
MFRPSRSGIVHDPLVVRAQKIRTLVGVGAVVWVSLSYNLARSLADVANERTDQSWLSVLMLSVTFPLAVAVLLVLAAPRARFELLRRAAKPFGAIVALISAVATFPATILTGFFNGKFATNAVMAVVTYTTLALILVWVFPFIVWGVGLALLHVFRTADIHETAPPLLATILVWEMAVVDLVTGAYAGMPGPLQTLFVLGAPLSVTAVAVWEIHRLRVHHNIAVRDMLMR